ncbi:hypothetical protein BS78_02G055900 [Paspalum vaginatum]|nr:hypothetical protein BS78_02G055900 [Paspalum vaginatum]
MFVAKDIMFGPASHSAPRYGRRRGLARAGLAVEWTALSLFSVPRQPRPSRRALQSPAPHRPQTETGVRGSAADATMQGVVAVAVASEAAVRGGRGLARLGLGAARVAVGWMELQLEVVVATGSTACACACACLYVRCTHAVAVAVGIALRAATAAHGTRRPRRRELAARHSRHHERGAGLHARTHAIGPLPGTYSTCSCNARSMVAGPPHDRGDGLPCLLGQKWMCQHSTARVQLQLRYAQAYGGVPAPSLLVTCPAPSEF